MNINKSQPSNTVIPRLAGLIDRDTDDYDKDAPYPEQIIRKGKSEYDE
jgi:hypothetical protein